MKTIKCFVILYLLTSLTNLIQAQSWLWARDGGSPLNGGASSVIVSANGNIYCMGGYAGTLSLDSVVLNQGNPSGNGFVVSCTTSGNFLNGTRIISSDGSHGVQGGFSMKSLNFDKTDNIYITGDMHGDNTFDTVQVSSNYDGYLAKFNSNLNGLDIKLASSIVYSCAFDNNRNIYLTGDISEAVKYIDTFTLYNSNANPLFQTQMFLAKLDSTGKCSWVKQSYGGDSRISKACIKNENVYLYGYMDSCVVFDTVNHCGLSDFVIGTDGEGNIKWASTYMHLNHGYFTSIDVDVNSNCYAIGGFDSTMYLQGYTLTKAPNSLYNGFIAKYDSTGVILWIKQFSSDSLFHFDKMHTDDAGNTYALGYFSKTGVFLTDTITAITGKDMFITRLNSDGDYLGIKILPSYVNAKDITQDSLGNAIVTGNINTGTTYFDSIPLNASGSSNFFLAKLEAITGVTSSSRTLHFDDRLVIYANPNTGTFTIEVPQGIVSNNRAQLGIYNSTGGIVKEEQADISNNKLSVDIGTVQKGMYTVTLSSGRKRYTGRVVIN